ncbi:MAG: hypothetical protein AAGG79_00150 [Pseudomonadota bacterium]
MSDPDDFEALVAAYVDNELRTDQRERFEAAMAESERLRESVAFYQKLHAGVQDAVGVIDHIPLSPPLQRTVDRLQTAAQRGEGMPSARGEDRASRSPRPGNIVSTLMKALPFRQPSVLIAGSAFAALTLAVILGLMISPRSADTETAPLIVAGVDVLPAAQTLKDGAALGGGGGEVRVAGSYISPKDEFCRLITVGGDEGAAALTCWSPKLAAWSLEAAELGLADEGYGRASGQGEAPLAAALEDMRPAEPSEVEAFLKSLPPAR